MLDVLAAIRRLALVGVVLSVLALPLGLIPLASALSPDIGDNEMGDTFALAIGLSLLILGVAGLILGSGLAVLAQRVLADPGEIRGPRRIVLATGLTVAGGQVLISIVLGGGWFTYIGLSAAFAAGFLVVGVASRRRAELVVAGVLALALLGSGVFVLRGQASQGDSLARRMERVALLPEMSVAIHAAAAAAPDGWAVATLAAKVTDFAPSDQLGYLPARLIGPPLRGLIVVDCAGSERLEVVALDGDTPVVLETIPCSPEPQVATIEVPGFTVHTDASATYVLGIEVDAVNEGSGGGMNRAMLLVALTGTPHPDRDALLAAFVAAFGREEPR